jgi:V8-like Glu-specific endopeptidase
MKFLTNKFLLLLFLFSLILQVRAQDAKYIFNADKSEVSVLVDINRAKLQAEDDYNKKRGMPLRIAKNYSFAADIDTIGLWQSSGGSDRVWKFMMDVPGAKGVIVSFSDFYIPQGGKLYVYKKGEQINDNTWVYTHEDNPRGGAYSLEVFSQDDIVFEYISSNTSAEPFRFKTSEIGYKYSGDIPGFNYSGNGCMNNINCPHAVDWQKQKMGIIRLRVNATSGSYACTGTLVNNAKEDRTPYVLTAAHCFPSGTVVDVVNTEFFFDYEFSGCENSSTRPVYKYHKGADLLVMNSMNGGSDGALIKMTAGIPDEWNVYFNGWKIIDTDGVIKDGSVIHHPGGDVKKISYYDNYLTTERWNEGSIYSALGAHWVTRYSSGSTAQGSSGAPIYDSEGYIVGTLTGGDAACVGRNINNGKDYYGKMAYHWDKSSDPDEHMKKYLDPDDTGITSMEGAFNKDDFEQDLILSLSEVVVEEYSSINVVIVKGNEGYQASSADSNIATAAVDGDKIMILGHNEGTTTITVTDKLGKTAQIQVKVTDLEIKELKLDEETAIVYQNKSHTTSVLTGNGSYQIEVDNPNIASATIEEDIIEIKGLNLGATKLVVKDKYNQTATLNVEVRRVLEMYTSAPLELCVRINDLEDEIDFITIGDLAGRVLFSKKNIKAKEFRESVAAIGSGTYLVMVKTLKRKTETRKLAW